MLQGEVTRFQGQIDDRISDTLTTNHYELGSQLVNGYQYPAVPVGTQSWQAAFNSIGAGLSGGSALWYGSSVDTGVSELASYLEARGAKCSSSYFVVGGYSQGAQVVGEAYNEKLSDSLRNRVVYQALFGDPRLWLPEGDGLFPAACLGLPQKSEWRFDVPDCGVGRGSLGARIPYLPAGFTSTTGLSCATHDFVCGSSPYPWDTDGHATYKDPAGSIDRAAAEIAKRLKPLLPPGTVDDAVTLAGAGTAGLDVVFLIDSTGSMGWQIESAKTFAADMASTIKDMRGRVALVEYKDGYDEFAAKILSGFQEDTADFNAKLSTVYASGGGDTPEAALHALMTGFDGLEWRSGATKAAVILTDAGYHDPDVVDGSTLATVAKRALEIDPVNVYPVVPSYVSGSYTALAEATTGQVILNEGDTKAALTTALTRLQNRPVALLAHPDYYAQPGQQITFDASASYSPGSTITKYDWDYNGDGTFEESTGTAVASRTYTAVSDGVMQVRMTDANGLIANASAEVHVGKGPRDAFPAAPTNVTAVPGPDASGTGSVTVTWESSDPRAAYWGLTIDGIPAGVVDGAVRTATIPDVQRDKDVEIGVVGFNKDQGIGDSATVVLPAKRAGFVFSGFQAPVDPAPTVNVMTAGRSVPMKFSLGGDFGLNILQSGSPTSVPVTCDTGAPLAEVETTTAAGSSSLTYDTATNTYTYVWKTDKAWAGTCRTFQMVLSDGNTHTAVFKYRA